MILDTCAVLWLAAGGGRLSRPTLKRIREAAVVYTSAISGFEIALKVSRGVLQLPNPPETWLLGIAEHHGILIIPLDLHLCVAAAQLPLIHNDPCDRMIIATAKANDIPVVTLDERFEEYGVEVIG
jgi:PIN domain nuclease of toxin-antitoxin system